MSDDAMGHILHNILNPPAEPGPPYTHTFSPLSPDPDEALAWLRAQIESDKAAVPWRPWALQRDVIADCEAKLALIGTCERVVDDDEGHEYYSDGWSGLAVARIALRFLAAGYRHREGYARFWGDPVTHTLTEDGQ